MDKKKIIEIVLKTIIYVGGLVLAALGVSAMSSCSGAHSIVVDGKTTWIATDTTHVYHKGYLKSKNYQPYD